MIKGAIFDLDGTLLDSMFIWDTIGEEYLISLGYEPKEQLNETFKEMSLYQAACYYRREYGVTLSTDEIMEGVNAMVERYYRDEVPLKNGVREFLMCLDQQGIRMCIATATDRPFVEAALRRLDIRGYFSEIFTCTEVGHGKDDPIIYQKALSCLGTTRADTLVFEDALYAIKTAKNDGFLTIGVFDIHERAQEQIRALSDIFLADYRNTESFWEFASAL